MIQDTVWSGRIELVWKRHLSLKQLLMSIESYVVIVTAIARIEPDLFLSLSTACTKYIMAIAAINQQPLSIFFIPWSLFLSQ